MNYIKFPNNFAELEEDISNYNDSRVVILPIPYEKTTTYTKGTKNGPNAIIKASRNMEIYDEELGKNISDIGICTLNPLIIDKNPEEMIYDVFENVKKIINKNKFPIFIGGEHSITPACIKAFAENYDDFSVLQLDAHTDLREEYNGTKFNHACTMRRSLEFCNNIVPVGIRSLCEEEANFIKNNKIKIFWAKDIFDNDNWIDEVVSKLSKNVYITFDLDVLDPSIMPSVGTPEPGGLYYYPLLKLFKKIFERKNIVGFDVVELRPNQNDISPDFTAAKIIYKMIGYKFNKNNNSDSK
jgi:agmatinase|tara:strand:- start:2463 stop:3356 length:894 start_codon:yes stop_codon:yes gene_type:complete